MPPPAYAATCDSKAADIDRSGEVTPQHIKGTPGPDVIVGSPHVDQIDGGLGDDIICGGLEADTIYGGEGDDVIFGYANPGAPGNTDLGNTIHGGPGNDTLYGSHGNDTLGGGSGEDQLYGGPDGDDVLYGVDDSNDVDDLDGGDPDDTNADQCYPGTGDTQSDC